MFEPLSLTNLFVWEALLMVIGYFVIFFVIGTIAKNNGLVDIGWGFGFVIVTWLMFFFVGNYKENTFPKIIINTLVSVWGLRLTFHLFKRNVFAEEDFRYMKWREEWGIWLIPRAFFQVFMLQAVFMFIVGLGVFYINKFGAMYITNWLLILGVIIWVTGFLFEVIGDLQLKHHIKTRVNKKELMTTGLWKYTRHPNYFGEALLWFGIFIAVLSFDAPIVLFISPLVITLLLRFVSGVPMLERKMVNRKGWDIYASKTNAFFPWFQKK